jgi:EAL domain-containing protein (putative c-di-GMP-specific phosphodiesterase class I)
VKYDHGQHFSSVLVSLGLNPSRVVIELPSAAVAHRTFLGYLTKSYQRFGFKVAGNLPNAGHIMSISDTAPLDFIKIDGGAVLRDAMTKPLVAYANRLGTPLIFDRVSNEMQFDQLQQFGARFVQGSLFVPHASSVR